MVCFSAPEGGVGPHIDQYDVFIIQGSGKRRWRVGDLDKGQYKESIQAGALRQIEGFDAIQPAVLNEFLKTVQEPIPDDLTSVCFVRP